MYGLHGLNYLWIIIYTIISSYNICDWILENQQVIKIVKVRSVHANPRGLLHTESGINKDLNLEIFKS